MIETIEDWNTRLAYCGCCEMPVCPTPTFVCEAKYKLIWLGLETAYDIVYGDNEIMAFVPSFTAPWVADEETGTIYQKVTINVADTTVEIEDDAPEKESTVNCTATTKTIVNYSYSTDIYGTRFETETTITYTLSEPITKAEFFTLIEEGMEADTWTVTNESSDFYPCSSMRIDQWPEYPDTISDPCDYFQTYPSDFGGPSALRKIRFRFRIPNAHLGSKYTITYDVARFPYDVEEDPTFVSEDNVVVWTGPGDQEDPEGDSWLTPWVELDPLEVSGEHRIVHIRIVNIRYTCYSGTKYGVRPQVMGEAFEPPAP